MERKLVCGMKAGTGQQSRPLCTWAGNMPEQLPRVPPRVSVNGRRTPRTLVPVLQMNVSKQASSATWNLQIRRIDGTAHSSRVLHSSFVFPCALHIGKGPRDLRDAAEDQGVPGTHAVPASAHDRDVQAAAAAAAPAPTSETVSVSVCPFRSCE